MNAVTACTHCATHGPRGRRKGGGTPVGQIAGILGHQSVRSTGVYLKTSLGLLSSQAGPGRAGTGGGAVSPAITMDGAITALVAEKRAAGFRRHRGAGAVPLRRVQRQPVPRPAGPRPGVGRGADYLGPAARSHAGDLQGLAVLVRELARWLGPAGRERLRPAATGAAPACPGHVLHPPASSWRAVCRDWPLSLLLAGPVPAPRHAGAVRTIYACGLRASEVGCAVRRRRPRCGGPDHPRRQGRQRPAGTGQRPAARTARRRSSPSGRAHRRRRVLPGTPGSR